MRQVKSFPATYEVKADEESGGWTLEGYASVFGNVDAYGDVVHKGAFSKTIKGRKEKIRFFWDHQTPLGRLLDIGEDEKGLKITARISRTALGEDVKTLVEDGAVGDFSFGYDVVEGEENEHGGLDLREVKLYEVSLVGIPANEEAVLTGVKSLGREQYELRAEIDALRKALDGPRDAQVPDPEPETKGATSFSDLPLAGEDTAWDASAATSRVAEWAGGEEIDFSKYRQAFFWYDADNPEQKDSYKLLFADATDGSLKAVPRGVRAAAAAVQGARGGVDIPESDVGAVRNHIARYYEKMGAAPPWGEKARKALTEEEKQLIRRAIDALEALLSEGEPEEPTPPKGVEPHKEKGEDARLFEQFRAELEGMKSIGNVEVIHG